MYHGWESEKGSQGTREDPPRNLYCLRRDTPAGRWADGSDEIKIKGPGPRSSGFGVITCAIGEHHLVWQCVRNHYRPRKFHFKHLERGLSSSGHTMNKVKMALSIAATSEEKEGLFIRGCAPRLPVSHALSQPLCRGRGSDFVELQKTGENLIDIVQSDRKNRPH